METASYRRSCREVDGRRRESPILRETSPSDGTWVTREQTREKNNALDGVYAGMTASLGLTAVDNPFSPQRAALQRAGTYSVGLPPTIFSASIVALLNSGNDCCLFWTRDIPVFIATLVSLNLQCGLTLRIAWMQFDETVELGTCYLGGQLSVRVACMVVFTMFLFGELMELVDMHYWLSMFQPSHKHTPLRIRDYEDKSGNHVSKPVTGVTCLVRFLLYFFVFFPKFLMLIALLIFGIPYIAYARTNTNLLLNTVALLFVAEIDEMVYKFAISKMYQDTLVVPALGRTEEEKARCIEMVWCGALRSYVLFFMLAISVPLSYLFWCQN